MMAIGRLGQTAEEYPILGMNLKEYPENTHPVDSSLWVSSLWGDFG
jgi:hypothetical protein